MFELKAHAFVAALSRLEDLNNIANGDADWLYDDLGRRDWFIATIDALLEHLELMRLRLAIKKAEDIRSLVRNNAGKGQNAVLAKLIAQKFGELRERVEQELEDRIIYCISTDRSEYLKSIETPFGDDVILKFPDASSDLTEASYCLAMSRNTACVFHLMRALEYAVKILGEKLEVTVIDKDNITLEWGKILSNLNKKIEGMPKGELKDTWASTASLLYHVKIAWRNSTMHPKGTYTEDEASSVYVAVRSFMTHLSSLM